MHLSTSGTSSARSTTPSPCWRWWSAYRLGGGTRPGGVARADEDEPGRTGAEDESLVVAVAGLGAAVADELHAEGVLVEVRALRGVAADEDDGVHGGDGEGVARLVVLDEPDELLEAIDRELRFAL